MLQIIVAPLNMNVCFSRSVFRGLTVAVRPGWTGCWFAFGWGPAGAGCWSGRTSWGCCRRASSDSCLSAQANSQTACSEWSSAEPMTSTRKWFHLQQNNWDFFPPLTQLQTCVDGELFSLRTEWGEELWAPQAAAAALGWPECCLITPDWFCWAGLPGPCCCSCCWAWLKSLWIGCCNNI